MSIKALEQTGEVAALCSPGSVLLVGPWYAFDRVSPRLLITDPGALRSALYPYVRDDANRQRLLTMYRRIMCSTSTSWQQTPEQVVDQMAGLAQAGAISAMSVPETSDPGTELGSASESEMQAPPGPVSQWSMAARFAYVLRRTPEFLPSAAAEEFRKLVTPEAIGAIVAALVVWAASHAVGVGQVVDVILIAVGFALVGWAIFDAIGHIVDFLTLTVNARGTDELDDAARALAQGATILGVGTLIALLTRGAGRLARQSGGRRRNQTDDDAQPGSSPASQPSAQSQRLTPNDFPEVGPRISQKQMRHIGGRPEHTAHGGGYMNSMEDAQRVLDTYRSGGAEILGRSRQGFPVVRVEGVTGTDVNPLKGIAGQPTNIFMIKGTASPSVVPVSPTPRLYGP